MSSGQKTFQIVVFFVVGGLSLGMGLVGLTEVWSFLLVLAGLAAGSVGFGSVGLLSVLGLVMTGLFALQAWLLMVAWPRRRRVFSGPGVVEVSGRPGEEVCIAVDGREVFRIQDTAEEWRVERVNWLVQQLAQLKGTVQDHRDLDRWRYWEDNLLHRVFLELAQEYEDNQALHPDMHGHEPAEPAGVIYDHHGMSYRWGDGSLVTLNAQKLTINDRTFLLQHLGKVVVLYQYSRRTNTYHHQIRAVAFGRVYTLLGLQGSGPGPYHNLNWFFQQLRDKVNNTSTEDVGTQEDVPQELALMLQKSGQRAPEVSS